MTLNRLGVTKHSSISIFSLEIYPNIVEIIQLAAILASIPNLIHSSKYKAIFFSLTNIFAS